MQLQPGLGLSETWYSWIVSIISVGELAGAVATSVLLRKVFTKFLMLANLSLCAIGGLLYGVGEYGWMLLIGKSHSNTYLGYFMFYVVTGFYAMCLPLLLFAGYGRCLLLSSPDSLVHSTGVSWVKSYPAGIFLFKCFRGGRIYTLALLYFHAGRFFIGYYMGSVTVVLRTYVGETCSTVIAAMPPEKREKSNLKNTAFFATFTVCNISVLSGPGEFGWPPLFTTHFHHTSPLLRLGYAYIPCFDALALPPQVLLQ